MSSHETCYVRIYITEREFMKNKHNLLPAFCMAALLCACGDTAGTVVTTDIHTSVPDNQTQSAAVETEFRYTDHLEDISFEGAEFRVRTMMDPNVTSYMNVAEESGDTLDDAIFQRNRRVEERFDITFTETPAKDDAAQLRSIIMAGDDTFELCNITCTEALNFWIDGLLVSLADVPHLELSQPYWAEKLNRSITLAGEQYTAIGAYDVNVLDLTYALVFNKELITKHGFTSPYELIRNGNWTTDSMLSMMTAVTSDINGDSTMNASDSWGFLSHPKMVAPNFWIGAGEMSILKDSDDHPTINMTSERFIDVFQKTFDITWEAGTWYPDCNQSLDVPSDNVTIFSEGRALFMDVSLYHIEALRAMEADFGIIPYPKYDEAQKEYYSRVSYYWATIVPTTNSHLDMTGTILEALNCESANTVIPAYYEIALKTKVSRDEESSDMLDLILENRIVDIGDTILCGEIRDGFIYQMFKSNNSDIVSQIKKKEKILQRIFDKIPTE